MSRRNFDRIFNLLLDRDIKSLNSHLPKDKKVFAELIKEETPHIQTRDGDVSYFNVDELSILGSLLSDKEKHTLKLPITVKRHRPDILGYNLKTKYDPEGEDKNIEIIVVDNYSKDRTLEIAKKYKEIKEQYEQIKEAWDKIKTEVEEYIEEQEKQYPSIGRWLRVEITGTGRTIRRTSGRQRITGGKREVILRFLRDNKGARFTEKEIRQRLKEINSDYSWSQQSTWAPLKSLREEGIIAQDEEGKYYLP